MRLELNAQKQILMIWKEHLAISEKIQGEETSEVKQRSVMKWKCIHVYIYGAHMCKRVMTIDILCFVNVLFVIYVHLHLIIHKLPCCINTHYTYMYMYLYSKY